MKFQSALFAGDPTVISRLAAILLMSSTLVACVTTQTGESKVPSSATAVAETTKAEPEEIETVENFARWLSQFRAEARTAGITEVTLEVALDNVRHIPRVIELDRAQPEFNRAVWDYLDSALSKKRIELGKVKLQQLRGTSNDLVARYGVPLEVLVAIWGIESNYGNNMGDIPTIDALATLGFEGRREDWARGQLIAALKILQNGDIKRAQMMGSWAGAMGQTQFLPSVYLAYALDVDGDGRRDIWASVPDVMASTANFLAQSGWQPGQPWGLEVRLPFNFDFARANADLRQSSEKWAEEGLRTMAGTRLPAIADASILLPAGARGPALLVGRNFRTILRYNNATSYALAVSLLAQRLVNGPVLQTPWPRDLKPLTRSQLLTMQTTLNNNGFDAGKPDGLMGPATQRGVRQFQRSRGLPADGYPTLDLLQHLQ